MVEAYIESQAFCDEAEHFFRAVKEVSDVPPTLLFRATERFVEKVGYKAGDLSNKFAMAGQEVSELVLRAYHQAEDDDDLRTLCLNAFDQLLAVEAYGALEALDSLERH